MTKRCGCGIHTPVCLWRPTVNQVREWEAGVGVEGAPVQLAPRPSLLQAHHVMSHLDGMGNGGRIGVVRQVSREAPFIGFPVTFTNGGITVLIGLRVALHSIFVFHCFFFHVERLLWLWCGDGAPPPSRV